MSLQETISVQCPNCWEQIELLVDCSIATQEYVEDCFVCCRPILISVALDDSGYPSVVTRAENFSE